MPPGRDGQAHYGKRTPALGEVSLKADREHREIIIKVSLAGFYHGDAKKQ
jgi:hypothetical protein